MLLTAMSTCETEWRTGTKQKANNRRGKKVRSEHFISKLSRCRKKEGQIVPPVLICYRKHLLVGNVRVKESCLYICVHFVCVGNKQFTQETRTVDLYRGIQKSLWFVSICLIIYPTLSLCFQKLYKMWSHLYPLQTLDMRFVCQAMGGIMLVVVWRVFCNRRATSVGSVITTVCILW